MDELEKHRAVTRRYLALGLGIPIAGALIYVAIWGAMNGEETLSGMALGGLLATLSNIAALYFTGD